MAPLFLSSFWEGGRGNPSMSRTIDAGTRSIEVGASAVGGYCLVDLWL